MNNHLCVHKNWNTNADNEVDFDQRNLCENLNGDQQACSAHEECESYYHYVSSEGMRASNCTELCQYGGASQVCNTNPINLKNYLGDSDFSQMINNSFFSSIGKICGSYSDNGINNVLMEVDDQNFQQNCNYNDGLFGGEDQCSRPFLVGESSAAFVPEELVPEEHVLCQCKDENLGTSSSSSPPISPPSSGTCTSRISPTGVVDNTGYNIISEFSLEVNNQRVEVECADGYVVSAPPSCTGMQTTDSDADGSTVCSEIPAFATTPTEGNCPSDDGCVFEDGPTTSCTVNEEFYILDGCDRIECLTPNDALDRGYIIEPGMTLEDDYWNDEDGVFRKNIKCVPGYEEDLEDGAMATCGTAQGDPYDLSGCSPIQCNANPTLTAPYIIDGTTGIDSTSLPVNPNSPNSRWTLGPSTCKVTSDPLGSQTACDQALAQEDNGQTCEGIDTCTYSSGVYTATLQCADGYEGNSDAKEATCSPNQEFYEVSGCEAKMCDTFTCPQNNNPKSDAATTQQGLTEDDAIDNCCVSTGNPCSKDQYVLGSKCMDCLEGKINDEGDDPTGPDTTCDPAPITPPPPPPPPPLQPDYTWEIAVAVAVAVVVGAFGIFKMRGGNVGDGVRAAANQGVSAAADLGGTAVAGARQRVTGLDLQQKIFVGLIIAVMFGTAIYYITK